MSVFAGDSLRKSLYHIDFKRSSWKANKICWGLDPLHVKILVGCLLPLKREKMDIQHILACL